MAEPGVCVIVLWRREERVWELFPIYGRRVFIGKEAGVSGGRLDPEFRGLVFGGCFAEAR
jgi:hypothetical protein